VILIIIMVPLGLLAILFYFLSVQSRKSYRCPNCGEQIKYVEHMDATRCGMCGSPIEMKGGMK